MPDVKATLQVTARASVIPGPLTIAHMEAYGVRWCACHGWHGHELLQCPAERSA